MFGVGLGDLVRAGGGHRPAQKGVVALWGVGRPSSPPCPGTSRGTGLARGVVRVVLAGCVGSGRTDFTTRMGRGLRARA